VTERTVQKAADWHRDVLSWKVHALICRASRPDRTDASRATLAELRGRSS